MWRGCWACKPRRRPPNKTSWSSAGGRGGAWGRVDGAGVTKPSTGDVPRLLGLQTKAAAAEYDVMIIGGGPAGLAAAVYGASGGVLTNVVERDAPAGHA